MPSPRTEFPSYSPRVARWLLPAGLLALTPKCVLCVLGYAGLGTALGLGGPDLCSPSPGLPATWTTTLAWIGATSVASAFGFVTSCRYGRRKRATRIGETYRAENWPSQASPMAVSEEGRKNNVPAAVDARLLDSRIDFES